MSLDLNKPTCIVIQSNVKVVGESSLGIVQSFLREKYSNYLEIGFSSFFDINIGDDFMISTPTRKLALSDSEPVSNIHHEVGSRLHHLGLGIKDNKSFAINLTDGDLFNKTAFDLVETLKDRYNVVHLNVTTLNILSFTNGLDKADIESNILYKYFKNERETELQIAYEDMIEDPYALINLFYKEPVGGITVDSLDEYTVNTSKSHRNAVVKVLDTFDIEYTTPSDDAILVDKSQNLFDIDLDIPGWTSYAKLHYLATVTKRVGKKATIVELGSWCGRSSYVFAHNRRKDTDKVSVSCYDFFPEPGKLLTEIAAEFPFEGKYAEDDRYSFGFFNKMIGDTENFETYRGDLIPHLADIKKSSIDLLFADAGHTYEETKEYLDIMYSKVKKGGLIVIDDYDTAHFEGACRAINEWAAENSMTIKDGDEFGCRDFAIVVK